VGICGPDGPGEEVTRRDSEVWASAPCSFQGQELGWKEGWTETLKDKSLPSPEDKQTCPWSAFSISLSHALMSPELRSLESISTPNSFTNMVPEGKFFHSIKK
jgi:hypothetical protein